MGKAQVLDFLGFENSSGGGRQGGEEKEFPREADYGLEEAAPDDIPTRVKVTPEPKKRVAPRSSAKFELRLAAVKESLEDELNDAGMAAGGFGFTTTGYVIMDGSQAFADAIVEMARERPRLLRALEKAGTGAKISKMTKYILAIALAAMVDMETRSPYDFPMTYLGVTQAYEKTHPDGPSTVAYQTPTFTPPPEF